MKKFIKSVSVIIVCVLLSSSMAFGLELEWTLLTEIPPLDEEQVKQQGLAGPIAGIHNDVLIVGGGANFPVLTKTAARGGPKVYYDDIYVLKKDGADGYTWLDKTFKLPGKSIGYSASLSTENGVLSIGGEGYEGGTGSGKGKQQWADVFYLTWNQEAQEVEFEALAPLPRGMSSITAAIIDNTVYVVEGQDFLSLDLSQKGAEWQALPTWPGPPRNNDILAAVDGKIYLFGGRVNMEGKWTLHKDAYRYDPASKEWTKLADAPRHLMNASGFVVGNDIIIPGGTSGKNLLINTGVVALRNEHEKDSEEWQKYQDQLTFLHDHQEGFSGDILVYNTNDNTWTQLGWYPGDPPVNYGAVWWDGDFLVVSGEIRAGVRTPKIWKATIQ